MRSIDTVSKPAARAVSTAARACRPLWRRPRKRSASSEKDCTPRDSVRTPSARQAAQASGVTSSGLASRKTHGAGVANARCARHASSTRAELFGRQLRGRSPAEVHGVERPRVAPLGRGEGHLRPPGGRRSAGGPGRPSASPRSRSTGRSTSRRERGDRARAYSSSSSSSVLSTDTKADWGISTFPTIFIFFLPSFCFSRSLRLRLMSPP